MSPASMLMIRGQLSATLSWNDVGFLQALWRSSDWVTAATAGVLSVRLLHNSAYSALIRAIKPVYVRQFVALVDKAKELQ